jgi:hypothetical protein
MPAATFRDVGVHLPVFAWRVFGRYALTIVNTDVPSHVLLRLDGTHNSVGVLAVHVVVQVVGAVVATTAVELVNRHNFKS